MSNPLSDSALVAAWPGSGLPNTAQSRMAHGANTSRLTTATIADQAQPHAARPFP